MKRGFIIHHNGPPANCLNKPHSRCEAFWASVKRFHMEGQGWSDIAYSFGVCPHGTRFVGRGWNKTQFASGKDIVGIDDGPDSAWYSVLAFIGGDTSTKDTEPPTPAMVNATSNLIAEGRASSRCGQRVLPHNALKPKPCPGPEFTALARKWDNAPLTVDAAPQEDDMPYLTTINGPGKPPRVWVDGALVGFPNQAELTEYIAAFVKAGYQRHTVSFAEADDWQRYMDGVLRVEAGVAKVIAAIKAGTAADVDEAQIAALVLAGLSPQAIAEAIPQTIATEVVDILTTRLAN